MPLSLIRIVRVCSLLAMLAFSRIAHAQGAQGLAPDPITTARLEQFLVWYLPDATVAQLLAIDAAHEEYLIAFRRIRNGEIAQFIARAQGAGREGAGLEELFRSMRQVQRTVSDADDAFTTAVRAIVGEGQSAAVQRMRDARERECLGSMEMMSLAGGESNVDLTQLVGEQKLAPALKQQAIQLLADYDGRATQAQRQLARESEEFGFKLATRMLALQKEFEGGAQDWSRYETIQRELVEEAGGGLNRARRAMKQTIDGGFESLRALLDPGVLHDIGSTVAAQLSNGMIEKTVAPAVGAAMQRVLRGDTLDAAQRESVLSVQREWCDADLRVMQVVVNDVLVAPPIMLPGDDSEKIQVKLQETQARRTELARGAWDKLASILGEATLRRYVARDGAFGEAMPYGPVPDDDAHRTVMETSASAAEEDARAANGTARYSFNFRPISPREVAEAIEFVALDDAQRAIVEQSHAVYTERFMTQAQPMLERATLAQSNLWSNMWQPQTGAVEQAVLESENAANTEGQAAAESSTDIEPQVERGRGQPTIDPAKVSELISIQVALFDLAVAADREFVEECATALGSGSSTEEHAIAPMLLSIRLIDLATNGGNRWDNSSDGRAVTPQAMADVLALADVDRAIFVAQCAAEFGTRMTALQGLARARYEGARRAEFIWWEPNPNATVDSNAVQVRYQAWQVKEAALTSEGAALVNGVLDVAIASMPEATRERAASERRKLAHPNVFRDSRNAKPLLHAALALENVDAARRGQLEALLAEYEMLYDESCEQLMQFSPTTIKGNMEAKDWEEYQTRAMEFERVKFERGERSAKAIVALRRILGATDSVRVAGLAGYDSGSGAAQK